MQGSSSFEKNIFKRTVGHRKLEKYDLNVFLIYIKISANDEPLLVIQFVIKIIWFEHIIKL